MVGSTALSERLDPEDFRDILASVHRVCRDAVDQYEGRVSQFLGDGVMAYFGYPTAHEDDAVRAVRASLRILGGVSLVNQGIGKRLGAEVQVRVGVHTGVAIVGDVGPGSAHDRRPVGETVNIAARVQSFADRDTIVVSASTQALVAGHFELESLGAPMFKGLTRPVEIFRVLRPTGARTKFEAAARGKLTPHVGRERELSELGSLWNEVREGADRVVVVRGEAGIGKSRIVHHFRQAVMGDGVRVLECFCSPLTQATAFAPIAEMLSERVIARAEGSTAAQAKLEALQSMLSEHSRFGKDALPLMAAALSIPGADEAPLEGVSSVRRRTRTLEVMHAWLASSAERAPVAFLVEDVHWADPSTLDLLDLIARENPGGRTLLCVTARPEFQTRWSAPHVRTFELARLSASEVEAIATHVAGGHALPPLVVRRIIERSEGVPLFVEELTKAVLESGALRLEVDRYEFARTFEERFLPSSVQGSLVARFDRLGDSRWVAQLGAAIGREFAHSLIRAVAGVSDDELQRHLDRLSRSELAFVHGEPPNAIYTFKHALIQDAIYATLLKTERARVHERIFSKLREFFPDLVESRPEMAAHHAESAGLRDLAVPLLKEAGLRAFRRTAMVEAVKHLRHAIELVGALEEPARTNTEIELRTAMGPAYMATLGWAAPEVEGSSSRLRELALAQRDNAKLFQAMWSLWTVHFLRGRLDSALDLASQVLGMAMDTADPMLRIAGHHAVGYTRFYRGEYQDALRHADDGLSLFELELERRIASMVQLSSSCAMWTLRTQSQYALGLPQQASASARNWESLVERLNHPPTRAHWLCQQCFTMHLIGNVDAVKAFALRTRSLSVAEGFTLWVPLADIFLAWAGARKGESGISALRKIEDSIKLLHGGGTYIVEPEVGSVLCETLLHAGQPQAVFRAAEDALAASRRGMVRHGEPELYRLQGEAARAMGDIERALAFYRQGIESARSMGVRLLELRSALALARLAGGGDEREELRRILDGFTDKSDQPDRGQALTLLETQEGMTS
jgi:class 3 adenylate cyclase/tetratricopeptide (TPR) repeat protein